MLRSRCPYTPFVTLSVAKGLEGGGRSPPRMFRRCGWLNMTL